MKTNENKVAITLYYEIYIQDLSKDYMDLIFLGTSRTIEEARICCRLFKEALITDNSRYQKNRGKDYSNCTVIFRPVLKNLSQTLDK